MLKLSITTERHGKIKIMKDKVGGAGIGGGSGVKSYPITQQTNPKSAPNLDCPICKKMEQGSSQKSSLQRGLHVISAPDLNQCDF